MRRAAVIVLLLSLASVSLTGCGFCFGMTGQAVQAVPNVVLGNHR